MSGDANLENVAEGITADGIQGRVTATSVSGRIVARNVREGVRANSVSGTIDISQSRGPLVLNTTSGAALLREVDSRDIQVATHSGAVHFAGKIYDNGRYTFDSFSSEVILTLPANSNFTLTAKTFSGSIETDFPIQLVTGSSLSGRPRRLQGTYGNSEGAQLNVGGFSSTIKLKKQ